MQVLLNLMAWRICAFCSAWTCTLYKAAVCQGQLARALVRRHLTALQRTFRPQFVPDRDDFFRSQQVHVLQFLLKLMGLGCLHSLLCEKAL